MVFTVMEDAKLSEEADAVDRRGKEQGGSPSSKESGGVIASLKHRSWRTPQESLVASLLRELGYRFREQWLLVVDGERLLFDFFLEEQILLECMVSDSKSCAQAWGTLRRRLTYLDFKFRLAKTIGTFSTVVLAEASACTRSLFPYPQTFAHLISTDHIVTTIPKLGQLLIDLLASNSIAAQSPVVQRGLDQWLGGSSKRLRHRKTSGIE